MGNQPSSEKEKHSGSRPQSHQQREREKEKDRRVNRRQSVQALQINSRGVPADPSATTASATAQTSSRPFETSELSQYVQSSPSPNGSGRQVNRMPSRRKKDEKDIPDTKNPAVKVPQSSVPLMVPVSRGKQESMNRDNFEKQWSDNPEPSPYDDRRYIPSSEMRPQRMPLPIAGEVQPIPESPTLGPVDAGTNDVPIFEDDVTSLAPDQRQLRRKSSVMSTGTQDEEDYDEELPQADPAAGTVQTTIEWTHAGTRVYITGTFANWERKFKMHHHKDGRKGHYVSMALPPGTHHLMFLVDDVMMTNPDLPTAVDFNNVLVNYIEIATEDLVKTRRESNQTAPTEKREIVYPAPAQPTETTVTEEEDGIEQPMDEAELLAEEILPGDFRQIIPQALDEIDMDEGHQRYQDAYHVISNTQGPPSLPLFLGKAILNGVLPNKDDSSVLGLPNHTVLNHLMTSSVRHGVLATSTTTRYKKKYVTTISFKPVPRVERNRNAEQQ